jgi:hypothetical protein
MAMRCFVAAALLAGSVSAHQLSDSRELRLQVSAGKLLGLLVYRVPPGPRAQMVFAPPAPKAKKRIDGAALRLAPQALRGLRIGGRAPRLSEGKTRLTAEGGVEAALLVEAELAPELTLEVLAGPPLPAQLLAPAGTQLTLLSGAGRPIEDGLELHPRSDLPCRVRITR